MDIKNCKRCGKVFVYNGVDLCPDCVREDEDDFKRVKEFLYQYPKSTILEIAEITGVDREKVWEFLREGKLELAEKNSGIMLKCERCGEPINSGRFCNDCLNIIKSQLETVVSERPQNNKEDKKYRNDKGDKFFTNELIKKHSNK